MPTIGEAVTGATQRLRDAGSETARLDAELLLGWAMGADRTSIVAQGAAPVGADALRRFEEAVGRRAAGEPVAYIRGIKEFHGLAFAVDARALIPRPETEALVDAAIDEVIGRLAARPGEAGAGPGAGGEPIRVADVGTGSGAVAVALAVALRKRRVVMGRNVRIAATDVSPDALDLARENAAGHAAADGMRFIEADLLPPVLPDDGARFDIILANLPYVRSDAIAGLPVATSFEPRLALDGGPDGLDVIRALLRRLPDALADGGVALLEIGADQGADGPAAVEALLPGWRSEVRADLAGLPRVLRVARP
ncbi:MAG TPA: peptide chain release factor N(5)-glutamine methyltransferase [Candidatus Limnocylindrales bacterium]|nr:peptide chain release factor N(5)-glutamine methyltransferase [Candidatus Limnocylindrales bacterium]